MAVCSTANVEPSLPLLSFSCDLLSTKLSDNDLHECTLILCDVPLNSENTFIKVVIEGDTRAIIKGVLQRSKDECLLELGHQ